MSRILVSYATCTGTTHDVAAALADELVRRGHEVDVLPCRRSPSSHHDDVVVVGSGVHHHHWLPEAQAYLQAEAPDLRERPTWLFQTGACADGQVDGHVGATPAPHQVLELVRTIGAAGPATSSRPQGEEPDRHVGRWTATGPCFGPFGSEDGTRAWADMISACTPDRRAAREVDDELGGGAGGSRQHAVPAPA